MGISISSHSESSSSTVEEPLSAEEEEKRCACLKRVMGRAPVQASRRWVNVRRPVFQTISSLERAIRSRRRWRSFRCFAASGSPDSMGSSIGCALERILLGAVSWDMLGWVGEKLGLCSIILVSLTLIHRCWSSSSLPFLSILLRFT